MPAEKVNKRIYEQVFCPSIEFDKRTGEAFVAPLGLRRVESGLMFAFDKDSIFLAHPDHIEKAVGENTKVVGLNVMGPIGCWPCSLGNYSGNTDAD